VRWACEIADYDELKTYVQDDASKTPSWISTQMLNQSLPNSAWAGTRMGAKAVWERVAGLLKSKAAVTYCRAPIGAFANSDAPPSLMKQLFSPLRIRPATLAAGDAGTLGRRGR
jgi:hypothetical protein